MNDGEQDGSPDGLAAGEADTLPKGWKAIFHFTAKVHLLVLLPALLLSVVAGILGPAMAIFFGRFFDAFSDFAAGTIGPESLMDKTLTNVYALIAVGAGTFILKGGLFSAWLVFGEMQAKNVRDQLFQDLLDKEIAWYEMRKTGVSTLLARLQTQIRELQMGTSQPLGFAVNYLIQALASLTLSFYFNWKLTFVILAGLPIVFLVLAIISRGLQANISRQDECLQRASKAANNTVTNIVIIKSFNTEEQESNQYALATVEAGKFYLKQALSNALQIGFVRFASTVMFVQGFWYGGILVHSGGTTPGKVITTFWSCLMATMALENILPHLIVLEKGRAAAVALRAVLNTVQKGERCSRKVDGLAPQFCEGDIEVRNVSFAYPSRPSHIVLQESTFFFPAGETTFVVGKSGSGKSTLGSLLMRFYNPRSGTILVDGNCVSDLDTSWLRNNITLVQQQSILFNETILKNIAFGHRLHERVTDAQIQDCLELAALQSTIARLPDGVGTRIGVGGSALSGGQKQRVAIARARLRNTPILILDESTSALDYLSKTSVMDAIREWRKDRTTIIITHDLTQIKEDDFAYVLQDGVVIAEGYRHELTRDHGRNMFATDTNRSPTPSLSSGGSMDDVDFGIQQSPIPVLPSLKRTSRVSFARQHLKRLLEVPFDQLTATTKNNLPQDHALPLRFPSLNMSQSRHFSTRPGIALENLKHQSTMRLKAKCASNSPTPREVERRQVQNERARTARPMSMHQALVMRSIYQKLSTDKELPVPKLIEMPKLLRRTSFENPIPKTSQEGPKVFSIQKILMTVWPQLHRRCRILLLTGLVAILIHAAGPPVFAYLLIQLFSTFSISTGYKQKALMYSVVILGFAVVDGTAAFLMHYMLEIAGQRWVDKLRTQAMTRVVKQPKAWFDQESNTPAYITSALDRNAEEMRNLVSRFAAFVLVVAGMMLIAIAWSCVTCWKMTLGGLATAPILYGVTKAFEVVSSKWEAQSNTASEQVGAVFVESFSDIRTVRALTLESYFHKKYTKATTRALKVGVRRALYSGFFFGLSDSAINFITALIFWFGAYLAKTYQYPVKSILEVFSLLLFSISSANAVVAYMPQIASSADTASRLLCLSTLPIKSHEQSGRIRLDKIKPFGLTTPINFINLTFYYPTRPETPALRRLNLSIPASRCTAIVGASGSGKSTIASLLLGLYPPTTDPQANSSSSSPSPPSLTVFGRDIRTIHLATLRSQIALVPQSPVLFPTSVRENITYGLPLFSPLTTASNIESAARQAGVHDFITSLPQGYATVIGDGGLGVSGGQAQRIVIARALVRNPRVLILDEATSALDAESAAVVRRSIAKLIAENRSTGNDRTKEKAKGKGSGKGKDKTAAEAALGSGARPGQGAGLTVIVITHAKEMMRFADHVVVMESGTAVEQGEYKALLRRRGKLWEMLKAGGALYKEEEEEEGEQ